MSSPDILTSASRCRALLSTREPHAEQWLRGLLNRQVPPEVTSAELQVFFQDDGGAPAVWMYFDGRHKRVSKTDLSIFPGRSMELDLGLDVLADLEAKDTDVAADAVKQWVAECWSLAGGDDYPIPVTLCVHDGWGDGKHLKLASPR